MIDRTMGSGPVSRRTGPQDERHDEHHQRDHHERAVEGGAGARQAVGLRIVREPGHGRRSMNSDGHDEGDVRRRRLADQVEDDRAEEQADRDVRGAPWSGWPSHATVEEILDRPDRPEQGGGPAMVEVAEGAAPSRRSCATRRASRCGHESPPWSCYAAVRGRFAARVTARSTGAAYPRAVHSGGKVGDKVDAPIGRFVDKPVVAARGPADTFRLARRGRCEPPDRTGERSSERSREPGSTAARLAGEEPGGDRGLRTCSELADPSNGRSSHQFLRALSCAPHGARSPLRAGPRGTRRGHRCRLAPTTSGTAARLGYHSARCPTCLVLVRVAAARPVRVRRPRPRTPRTRRSSRPQASAGSTSSRRGPPTATGSRRTSSSTRSTTRTSTRATSARSSTSTTTTCSSSCTSRCSIRTPTGCSPPSSTSSSGLTT